MKRDLEEKKPHGNKDFPFEAYSASRNGRKNNFVASHWHEEIEMLRMIRGNADLVVEGKSDQMQVGEVWLFNPGEIHQITSQVDTGNYYSFVFSIEILGKDFDDSIGSTYLRSIRDKWNLPRNICPEDPGYDKILPLLDSIYEAYENKPPAWQMIIRANLYLVFVELIQNHRFILREQNVSWERSKVSENLRRLLQYIEDHYSEKIRLEDASKIMNLSPKYFCTLFHDTFHLSFVNYLNRFRIDKACLLLQSSDAQIIEIAMKVGFDNISYFIRKFQEIEGCTPNQYRKKYRKERLENL